MKRALLIACEPPSPQPPLGQQRALLWTVVRLPKRFLPRPSHACLRCILLCFPFSKATYDFFFPRIFRNPSLQCFHWLKLTLPGRIIQETISEFGHEGKPQIGCFSCRLWSPVGPQNLPKFRDSSKAVRPRVWVVVGKEALTLREAKCVWQKSF